MFETTIELLYGCIVRDGRDTPSWSDAVATCAGHFGAHCGSLRADDRLLGSHGERTAGTVAVDIALDTGANTTRDATLRLGFASTAAARAAREDEHLDRLASHFARALHARRALERADDAMRLASLVTDRLAIGIGVADRSSRLVLLNAAGREFLVRNGHIALGEPDRLRCGTASDTARLRAAIERICSENAAAPRTIRLQLVDGRRDAPGRVVVEVEALPCDGDPDSSTRALVTFIDPGGRGTLDLDRVSDVYRLSVAERAVLTLMLSGCTNRQIAEARSVTIETVRSQATALRRKLNVSRRSELFGVISAMHPAWLTARADDDR